MKIQKSKVTKLLITDVKSLDPIAVFLEDFGKENQAVSNQGKVTIECFGKSWSAYWGSMGSETVSQFIATSEDHYLINCFDRGIRSEIGDFSNLKDWMKKGILALRWGDDISKDTARDLWDEVELSCGSSEEYLKTEDGARLAYETNGDDWYFSLPTSDNPEYVYLERIVFKDRNGNVVVAGDDLFSSKNNKVKAKATGIEERYGNNLIKISFPSGDVAWFNAESFANTLWIKAGCEK